MRDGPRGGIARTRALRYKQHVAGVTQLDMARRLGVSQALVARALRDDPAVAAATRERVQAMARQLGYRPNATARALLTGKTGLVSLWIARAYGSFSARIIFALERLARQSGYDLVITDLGPYGDPDRDLSHFRLAVDGLLVADAPWHAETLAQRGGGIPCVSMGTLVSRRTDAVQVDLTRGARAALAHVRKSGRSRVLYVTPSHPLGVREVRYRAFRKAHPQGAVVVLPEPTRAAAYQTIQSWLAAHGPVDAIFCHNDDYAIGVLRGLRDRGLRVPEDVSVVGCDGVEDAEYLACPLTTIAIPIEDMCQQAWRFLTERLAGARPAPRRHVLHPELVIRQSTVHRRVPTAQA